MVGLWAPKVVYDQALLIIHFDLTVTDNIIGGNPGYERAVFGFFDELLNYVYYEVARN